MKYGDVTLPAGLQGARKPWASNAVSLRSWASTPRPGRARGRPPAAPPPSCRRWPSPSPRRSRACARAPCGEPLDEAGHRRVVAASSKMSKASGTRRPRRRRRPARGTGGRSSGRRSGRRAGANPICCDRLGQAGAADRVEEADERRRRPRSPAAAPPTRSSSRPGPPRGRPPPRGPRSAMSLHVDVGRAPGPTRATRPRCRRCAGPMRALEVPPVRDAAAVLAGRVERARREDVLRAAARCRRPPPGSPGRRCPRRRRPCRCRRSTRRRPGRTPGRDEPPGLGRGSARCRCGRRR